MDKLDKMISRFYSKLFEVPKGCLEFRGAHTKDGYGQAWFQGKVRMATHVAWFLKHGVWPEKLVLHKCDNPPCVRVEHLFQGTQADNLRDCVEKGRMPRGEKVASAKITDVDAEEIRALCRTRTPLEAIARRFGVTIGHVNAISRQRVRAAYGEKIKKPWSFHKSGATVEYEGREILVSELALLTGVRRETIIGRMKRGLRGKALTAGAHENPRGPYKKQRRPTPPYKPRLRRKLFLDAPAHGGEHLGVFE